MRITTIVAVSLLLAGCSTSGGSSSVNAAAFSLRPVLCYAPPYAPSGTSTPRQVPACALQYRLTASNLDVQSNSNSPGGFAINSTVPPDPQFAAIPSTSGPADLPGVDVVLPGTAATGTTNRFVLGPAQVTASAVESAFAQDQYGQWVVNLDLTSAGAEQWDALASTQFHALVAVVVNGQVASAPIIQPTQSTFTPFSGRVQISGNLTARQANALVVELQR